jgi:O-antigen ligase
MIITIFIIRGIFPDRMEKYLLDVESRTLRYDAGMDFTGGRLDLFIAGMDKFAEAPIFGIGTGFWYEYWKNGNYTQRVPDHFGALSVLIRGGLFTTLPIVLLILWYIPKGFLLCRKTRDPSVQPFVIASYLYTLVIFFYSLFGNPQNVLEASLLFWLSISVVMCVGRQIDDGRCSENKTTLKPTRSAKMSKCNALP